MINNQSKTRYYFYVLPLIFIMSACYHEPNEPGVLTTVNPTPQASHSSMLTPEPTSTLSLDSTPSLEPTRSEEQIQEKILAALELNRGCRFPCWLGISPGQTSDGMALELLGQIDFTGVYNGDDHSTYWGGLVFSPIEADSSVFYDLVLQNEIVNTIRVRVQGYRNQSILHRSWNSVTPESIIRNYGAPSRVWIESHFSSCEGGEPCISTIYYLWIFYDDQGFLIKYQGSVDYQSVYTFCPTYGENGNLGGSIEIFTRSSDDVRPLENLSDLPSETLIDIKDFVSLTGIPLDEFAAQYEQPNQSFCFRTPRDIWP